MSPRHRFFLFLSNPNPPWWASAALWGWTNLLATAFLWTSVPTLDSGLLAAILSILRILTLVLTILAILTAYLRRETRLSCYRIISDAANGVCPRCRYEIKDLKICPECSADRDALAHHAAKMVGIPPK